MDETLHQFFIADQADRQEPINWEKVNQNDSQRRKQVQKMIDDNLLIDSEDFYHAAMVFQHGENSDDYKNANELAKKSMDMGYEPAKWLFAASFDRYLLSIGKHQKFGTQFRFDENGKKLYFPIDPKTTDGERRKYNVPIKKRVTK